MDFEMNENSERKGHAESELEKETSKLLVQEDYEQKRMPRNANEHFEVFS